MSKIWVFSIWLWALGCCIACSSSNDKMLEKKQLSKLDSQISHADQIYDKRITPDQTGTIWLINPEKLSSISHDMRIKLIRNNFPKFVVIDPGGTEEDWLALEKTVPSLTVEHMSQIYSSNFEGGCTALDTIGGSVYLSKEPPTKPSIIHQKFCAVPFDLNVTPLSHSKNVSACNIWGSTPIGDYGAISLKCGHIDKSNNFLIQSGAAGLAPDYISTTRYKQYASCRVKHRLLLESSIPSITCASLKL